MKKLLSFFVALFIAAGSVFAAAAAQGTINLVTASVTYSHRYTSGNGILDLMPSMNTYHYVQDINCLMIQTTNPTTERTFII